MKGYIRQLIERFPVISIFVIFIIALGIGTLVAWANIPRPQSLPEPHLMIIEYEVASLQTLIERVSPSVVLVESRNRGGGSGVIVAPHIVLTAGHVVRDATEIYVETVDGEKRVAIGWVEDEKNDCGLIFFDPREKFDNIAEFADSNELQLGDTVFTIGSPFGKEHFNAVTHGIISGLERKVPFFGTRGLVTSDAAGNPGNSGGPVFDMNGRIVGIVVGSKWGAEGLNIITASNICKELLQCPQ